MKEQRERVSNIELNSDGSVEDGIFKKGCSNFRIVVTKLEFVRGLWINEKFILRSDLKSRERNLEISKALIRKRGIIKGPIGV